MITSIEVTSGVESIADNAFSDCGNATTVTVADTVTSVGAEAFAGCDSLETVTFTGDAPQIGEKAFDNVEAVVQYPANNDTWSEDVQEDFGGDITWVEDSCQALGTHTFDQKVAGSEVAATCTANGSVIMSCKCGATETKVLSIDKNNHVYKDGTCSGCGKSDPNYSNVVVSEDCSTMTITYKSSQNHKSVQFAVWSEAGGQDDLKWYTAEKGTDGKWTYMVELSLHRTMGKYFIHVYSVEDGVYNKQTEYTATVNKQIPPGSGVVMSDDFKTMTITYTRSKNHEHVHFAVWSEMGAHDDLHWYASAKGADGNWTYTVDMDEYNTAGKYYVHVYSIDGGVYTMQSEYTVNVVMEDAPVYGTVQITENDAVMTISYSDGRDYQHLHYAVWSDKDGQNDLRWYAGIQTAKGVWTYVVDLSLHQSAGSYSIHAYSIEDGVYTKQGEYTANAKKATALSALARVSGDCKTMTLKYTGSDDCKDIRYAVWSVEGGQDDLYWYTATKGTDGKWKATVDLTKHNTVDNYIIHVYSVNGDAYTWMAEYTAFVDEVVK